MNNREFAENNLLVKTLSGSRAYGMSNPQSDWDIRGVFAGSRLHILSPFAGTISHTENKKDEDTAFFELSKWVKLVIDQNPNVVELLWVDPSDVLFMSPAWLPLQSIRKDLLSKRLMYTYSGYAMQQLSKMKSHDKWINNPKSEIAPTPDRFVSVIHNVGLAKEFNQTLPRTGNWTAVECGNDTYLLFEGGSGSWFDSNGNLRTLSRSEAEPFLGKAPAAIFKFNRELYESEKRDHLNYWEWRKNRNKSRGLIEEQLGYDPKNAAHLVRLMRTAKEALQENIIRVRRPDAKELLEIRNGSLTYDQMMFLAERLNSEVKEAADKSCLPKELDKSQIAEIVAKMYETVWKKENQSLFLGSTNRLPEQARLAPDIRQRVVCVDFEATGYASSKGQIVEIGAVEIIGGVKTGKTFHSYVNPQSSVTSHARRIHGLTNSFLKTQPTFDQVVAEFLSFCQDSPLVMHGASSDVKMINHELGRFSLPFIDPSRIVCSQRLGRWIFPGWQASLDHLCDTLEIDRTSRQRGHSAIVDADLLANCLIEMSSFPAYTTANSVGLKKMFLRKNKENKHLVSSTKAFIVDDSQAVFERGDLRFSCPLPPYPKDTHKLIVTDKGHLIIYEDNLKNSNSIKKIPDNPLGPAVIHIKNGSLRGVWFVDGKPRYLEQKQEYKDNISDDSTEDIQPSFSP